MYLSISVFSFTGTLLIPLNKLEKKPCPLLPPTAPGAARVAVLGVLVLPKENKPPPTRGELYPPPMFNDGITVDNVLPCIPTDGTLSLLLVFVLVFELLLLIFGELKVGDLLLLNLGVLLNFGD